MPLVQLLTGENLLKRSPFRWHGNLANLPIGKLFVARTLDPAEAIDVSVSRDPYLGARYMCPAQFNPSRSEHRASPLCQDRIEQRMQLISDEMASNSALALACRVDFWQLPESFSNRNTPLRKGPRLLKIETSNSSGNTGAVAVPGRQRLLVVTPTLGVSTYLDETVRGVTSLQIPFLHVLSCPRPVVAQLQERFPHATVIADAGKEAGLYGAINVALQAAGEDWQWFTYINDDDELAPSFSKVAQLHFAKADPEPVVYGNVRVIDESGGTISLLTTENSPRFIPALLCAGISPLNQQGMLFRRDVVQELGEFNTKYRICADLDFWARALAAGHRFRYYPVEVGRFRIRRGQISGDVNLTSREQDEIARRLFPKAGGALNQFIAKWRYRLRNLPRYLSRGRTVGWVSSYQILSQGGRPD
jgi:hypothetical protein